VNGNGGVTTGMLDRQQVKTLYEQHGRVLLAYAVPNSKPFCGNFSRERRLR
jgi:hypothetical protein